MRDEQRKRSGFIGTVLDFMRLIVDDGFIQLARVVVGQRVVSVVIIHAGGKARVAVGDGFFDVVVLADDDVGRGAAEDVAVDRAVERGDISLFGVGARVGVGQVGNEVDVRGGRKIALVARQYMNLGFGIFRVDDVVPVQIFRIGVADDPAEVFHIAEGLFADFDDARGNDDLLERLPPERVLADGGDRVGDVEIIQNDARVRLRQIEAVVADACHAVFHEDFVDHDLLHHRVHSQTVPRGGGVAVQQRVVRDRARAENRHRAVGEAVVGGVGAAVSVEAVHDGRINLSLRVGGVCRQRCGKDGACRQHERKKQAQQFAWQFCHNISSIFAPNRFLSRLLNHYNILCT